MNTLRCPRCRCEIRESQESAGLAVACPGCGEACPVSESDSAPAKNGTPPWAWVFAVLCGLIPVITLGGAIPMAIGVGGAGGCLSVARGRTMHVAARVGICSGITFACWCALGVLVIGVAVLQGPPPSGAEAAAPGTRRSALVPENASAPKRTRVTMRPGAPPKIEHDYVPQEPQVEAVEPKIYLSHSEPSLIDGLQMRRGGFRRSVTISGVEYENGIWAQPSQDKGICRISFPLNGRYSRLRGVAGMSDDTNRFPVNDERNPAGVFRIHADGQLVWRSNKVVGAGSVEAVDLDITDVDTITLSCESNTYSYMARTAWGDLELVE